MNDTKNEDLTKARKRFNIYKLINDLNSINDCGDLQLLLIDAYNLTSVIENLNKEEHL